jgi:hypothetical protein
MGDFTAAHSPSQLPCWCRERERMNEIPPPRRLSPPPSLAGRHKTEQKLRTKAICSNSIMLWRSMYKATSPKSAVYIMFRSTLINRLKDNIQSSTWYLFSNAAQSKPEQDIMEVVEAQKGKRDEMETSVSVLGRGSLTKLPDPHHHTPDHCSPHILH